MATRLTPGGFQSVREGEKQKVFPTPKPAQTTSGGSVSERGITYENTNSNNNVTQQLQAEVLRSGGVKIGNEKYIGNIIVPNTGGKTANQLQKELREQYYQQTGQRVGAGYLSGTFSLSQGNVSNSNLVFIKDPMSDKQKLIEQQKIIQAKKFGTQPQNFNIPDFSGRVQTQPYIFEQVIDVIKDKDTGKKIEITEITYRDPREVGQEKVRPATKEEIKSFKESQFGERYTNVALSKNDNVFKLNYNKAKDFIGLSGARVSNIVLEPVSQTIGKGLDVVGKGFSYIGFPSTFSEAQENVYRSSEFLKSKGVPSFVVNTGEFISGVGLGTLQDIREKPLKNVLTIGTGAVVGAGLGLGSRVATTIGKTIPNLYKSAVNVGAGLGLGSRVATTIGKTIPNLYKSAVNVGGGLLTLGYTANVILNVGSAQTIYEKGSVVGVAGKDLTLFGFGAYKGTRASEKIYDVLRTKQRVELPIEDIGFKYLPEAVSGKVVKSKSFGYKGTSGIGKQIFDIKIFRKAGRGYHVAPEGFALKEITARAGSSEFKGLYTAPTPSYYFAKITNLEKPKVFGLYQGIGKPEILTIETKDFNIKGLKKGSGYVTGIKSEIEAVFKEGSRFVRTSNKVYVEYKGRRLTIDTFEPIKESKKLKFDKIETTESLKKSYSSSNLKRYSYINPTSASFIPSYKTSNNVYTSTSKGLSYTNSFGKKNNYYSSVNKTSSFKQSKQNVSSRIYNSSKVSYGSFSGKSDITSSINSLTSYRPPTEQTKINYKDKFKPKQKFSQESFIVSVRRRGKFKPIAVTGSIEQAFKIGTERVSKTLGATFKVQGSSGLAFKTPKGFYAKQEKGKTLFIEQPKYRLSTGGEKQEIKLAKLRLK